MQSEHYFLSCTTTEPGQLPIEQAIVLDVHPLEWAISQEVKEKYESVSIIWFSRIPEKVADHTRTVFQERPTTVEFLTQQQPDPPRTFMVLVNEQGHVMESWNCLESISAGELLPGWEIIQCVEIPKR